MKAKLLCLVFAIVSAFAISACADENIQPQGGGGAESGDRCQFGCP